MPAVATCMSARLPKHLDDAAHAAALALKFLAGRSLDDYRADEMLRSAVERQVEIVGEACRRALDESPPLRDRMPEFRLALAMRNRIAHGYDTVDLEVDDALLEQCLRSIERATLPDCLEITAWTEDDEIMGVRHKTLKIEGIQFHPESILSQYGHDMLKNFLDQTSH